METDDKKTKTQLIEELNALKKKVARLEEAEQSLRESKDKYRQLFTLESDAIFLIDNTTARIRKASGIESSKPARNILSLVFSGFNLIKLLA